MVSLSNHERTARRRAQSQRGYALTLTLSLREREQMRALFRRLEPPDHPPTNPFTNSSIRSSTFSAINLPSAMTSRNFHLPKITIA